MTETGRLNGLVAALEAGKTAFGTFSPPEFGSLTAIASQPYDAVIIELEHNPFDLRGLRESLHYLLDRRQIATSGSLQPAVTPLVRIPPNGSEMNQWIAKQVLDMGLYGIVWPHIATVEEARNAVATCRYPRPSSNARYEPAGKRGHATSAARYWGIEAAEYYDRADVWPLDPAGEIFVCLMIESVKGITNLPDILNQVQGIGAILIGESDLSRDLGIKRDFEDPQLVEAVAKITGICNEAGVVCGIPHVNAKRVDSMLELGMRFLVTPPERSFKALEAGLRATGRESRIKSKPAH